MRCECEVEVIAALFRSVGDFMNDHVVFYNNGTEAPAADEKRRAINLDDVTDEDYDCLRKLMAPIFQPTPASGSDAAL